ncbi:MAG: DNA polymerase III subunit beta [Deltaproteobacteria bacterium RIFCSPHIGHO2_12_FULL_43_9]|nr:MAG: DNA polymerase III subunit beta [Deltaproteobacteria bacterium RIFCSPHIGHO2_12_FULL_43_9]
MEFYIGKAELLRGLYRAQSIVEKRNAMPILANVLLEATNERLKILATDLEVGIYDTYEAKIIIPGKITIGAKQLYEIVRELPEALIHIKARENHWITLTSQKAVFNIVGLSAEDYPAIIDFNQKKFVPIPATTIKDMIEKTIFSTSNDETRYHLNGVYFSKIKESGKSNVRMIATDGHRLSLIDKPLEIDETLKVDKGVILPKKGLHELKKLLEEDQGDFEIAIEENHAIFKKEPLVLFMRLIDGEYPDCKQVIPKNNKKRIVVKREEFLHSLKRISLLSNEKSKGVKFSIQPGMMKISSNHPELGEANEELMVDYQGEEIEIGFNAKYFMDILNVMDSEEVSLELDGKLSPGVIKSNKDQSYTCVVMPMRI